MLGNNGNKHVLYKKKNPKSSMRLQWKQTCSFKKLSYKTCLFKKVNQKIISFKKPWQQFQYGLAIPTTFFISLSLISSYQLGFQQLQHFYLEGSCPLKQLPFFFRYAVWTKGQKLAFGFFCLQLYLHLIDLLHLKCSILQVNQLSVLLTQYIIVNLK